MPLPAAYNNPPISACDPTMLNHDPVWENIKAEASVTIESEPILAPILKAMVLEFPSLEAALCHHLAAKLAHPHQISTALYATFTEAFQQDPQLGRALRRDIQAFRDRDPACNSYLSPTFYYKGFQALSGYRIAHHLWRQERQQLAFYLESMISQVFAVDIHPAAQIGSGILLDHATGFVAGETTVVEDHVSILHEVTLGGTGKECGDRHPKIRRSVLIGAGVKILGNVEIGEGAKIGAGSVVLKDVAPHTTVAGVPAVVVGRAQEADPAVKMDHNIC